MAKIWLSWLAALHLCPVKALRLKVNISIKSFDLYWKSSNNGDRMCTSRFDRYRVAMSAIRPVLQQ